MRTAILMAAFLSFLGNLFGADQKPPFEIADIYRDMRGTMLGLKEIDAPQLKGKPILAVLMDTGIQKAAYTLVTVADGTTSVYFSNGGGTIGAGEHESVRKASLKLVKMAEDFIPHMKKTDKFPIATPGETTFHVVTPDGVLSYTAKTEDLGEKRDKKMSDLFYQAHEVISQVRMLEKPKEK